MRWSAAVAGLTALGAAIRLHVAGQSVFGDELSTYYIVSTNGLGGVIATVHGNAEITPPLSFAASWLTTRLGPAPELMRAPSLLAGTAGIPLTYLLGLRTAGRAAGLVAAAITALAPFTILASAEARGYALLMALVMLSTLALLRATEDRRARWWVAYAAASCAAVYTHYTAVFVLGAQFAWVLWAHPEARRAVVAANAGAVVAFLPWLSGLVNDLTSPTTRILSLLGASGLDNVRITLEHWAIGYPYVLPTTTLRRLPGEAALIALAVGSALAAGGLAARWRDRPRRGGGGVDRRLVLIAALALSSAVAAALVSIAGINIFSVRTLAASWPGFAIGLAAVLVGAGRRLSLVTVPLALMSFAVGAAKMLEPGFRYPDYEAAARFVDRHAGPGDVVVDASGVSPAPITVMDVALDRPHRLFAVRTGLISYRPFRLVLRAPSPEAVARQAAAAARGRRVFVVASDAPAIGRLLRSTGRFGAQVDAAMPAPYRRVATRSYPGILTTTVSVFAAR